MTPENEVAALPPDRRARQSRAVALVRPQRLRDSPEGAVGGPRDPPAHRLGAGHALLVDACGLPRGHLGGIQLGRIGGHGLALSRAHVRDHRFLSPLFLSSHLQNLARRPIHLWTARRLRGAARADMVGGAPSPSSRAFGQARGRAFTGAARLLLEPHGLVHVAQALRCGSDAGEGSAQVSGASVLGSI